MCRGQRYDNASAMSGIHAGVQRRIKDLGSNALFAPCGSHSLNLAGVHAVGSPEWSYSFFCCGGKNLFFSASTHRWALCPCEARTHCIETSDWYTMERTLRICKSVSHRHWWSSGCVRPVFFNPESVDANQSAEGSGWVRNHYKRTSLL